MIELLSRFYPSLTINIINLYICNNNIMSIDNLIFVCAFFYLLRIMKVTNHVARCFLCKWSARLKCVSISLEQDKGSVCILCFCVENTVQIQREDSMIMYLCFYEVMTSRQQLHLPGLPKLFINVTYVSKGEK